MKIFVIYGRNYDSNIYVVVGEVVTVIDTGTGFYHEEIIKEISRWIDPRDISQIVLTHEHFDHCGGVEKLLECTDGDACIMAHGNAVDKLSRGESSFARMLGGVMPQIKVDRELSDGDDIVLGDERFRVISTPGHTPGSICLYEKNSGSLISGDTVFSDGDFGRYDLPGGDLDDLVNSIQRLSKLDVKNLYPGHGPCVMGNAGEHVLMAWKNIQSIMGG